jgi:hypothetical protein
MSTPHFAETPPLIAAPQGALPQQAREKAPPTVLAGLWIMGLFGLYSGLQQQLLPRVFYDQFPGFGMTWVSPDGPFNEHLMRDLGGANLALTFLIFLAIARPTAYLVHGVAIATLIAQVPHFVYHAMHLDLLPNTLERALQTISLGLVLLVPVLILIASHSMTEGRSAAYRE